MTGGRGRGRGSSTFRGANRGRGGFNNEGHTPNKSSGLDALTGGTVARRGSGRGNSSAGTRGRGASNTTGGSRKQQEETSEPDNYTGIKYSPKHAQNSGDPLNSTPYPRDEYAKRFAYLKHAQAYKKQEQIAKGQMDPDGQMDISKSVDKHGLCEDLCPEFERMRRIVQNDVAGPEYTKETAHGPRDQRTVDETRMIAAHHRSAAGEELTLMTDLRTPAALQKSMVTMITRLKGDSFDYLNGWIWDRSRAVRVELSKNYRKREDTESFLGCYEMCIRFHLLSMHQMLNRRKGVDYDRQTDWEQLGATCNQIKTLWEKIKVYVPEDGVTPCPLETSRVAEIHAYNIILGLKENEHREEVRRHPRVRTAQALVRACSDTKDYTTFWRMIRSSQVSYLMACAAATRFMSVRSDTLETMIKGCMVHKQKVDDWTPEKLVDILGFDDEDQVRTFCQAYGGEFETNAQGVTYLRAETITMRKDPFGKNHFFSQKYVESKRGGRNLAAVLFGYNVLKARYEGLLEVISDRPEDSLFIPDSSAPSAPSNPFAAMAAASRKPVQPSGMFSTGIQPGLFDPSKNSVKFAPSASTTAPSNPFAKVAAELNVTGQPSSSAAGFPSTSTGLTAPAATAPSGLSASAKTFSPFAKANTFGFLAGQKALDAPKSTNESTPGSSIFSTSTPATNAFTGFKMPEAPKPASSAASTTTFPALPAFTTPNAPSSSATGSFTSPAGISLPKPAETPSIDEQNRKKEEEEQQRKAEEARKKALEEEQQRKAQEEQRRAAEEQRRRAEEERRRKLEEEQAKARAQEQQRQLREQQERERLRIQQEAARRAEEQRRQALEALTIHLFDDPREGMMKQYLENMVDTLVKDTKAALRKERQAQDDAKADEMWQQKRQKLARAAFYRWAQQVHKKRRMAEARQFRDRRRRFKDEIAAAKSSAASSAASPPAREVQAVAEVPVDQPVAQRWNRLSNGALRQSQRESMQPPRLNGQSRELKQSAQSREQSRESSIRPEFAFSQSYYDARAQSNERQSIVDRTETDYFRLRAIGVDPNKLRKRSLDSSDDEDTPRVDNKRARTSSSSITQQAPVDFRKSLPAPSTDEERLARFRALKETMSKTGHSLSRSVDFNSSRMSTFDASTTSAIIQRARETLGRASVSRQSTPDMVGMSLSDKPAYWARQSRFVPQHLYGQPEAIRAYRMQVDGRTSRNSQTSPLVQSQSQLASQTKHEPDPLGFLSSPVSIQQSYNAGQQQQSFDIEDDEPILLDDDAEDAEGEDEEEDEGEFDEYGEDEQDEGQEGEYYSDEEEEYSEDDVDEQLFSQKPGGTEDDAIELSD